MAGLGVGGALTGTQPGAHWGVWGASQRGTNPWNRSKGGVCVHMCVHVCSYVCAHVCAPVCVLGRVLAHFRSSGKVLSHERLHPYSGQARAPCEVGRGE